MNDVQKAGLYQEILSSCEQYGFITDHARELIELLVDSIVENAEPPAR